MSFSFLKVFPTAAEKRQRKIAALEAESKNVRANTEGFFDSIISSFSALHSTLIKGIDRYLQNETVPDEQLTGDSIDGWFHGDKGMVRAQLARSYLQRIDENNNVALLGLLSAMLSSSSSRLIGLFADEMIKGSKGHSLSSSPYCKQHPFRNTLATPVFDKVALDRVSGWKRNLVKNQYGYAGVVTDSEYFNKRAGLKDLVKMAIAMLPPADRAKVHAFQVDLQPILDGKDFSKFDEEIIPAILAAESELTGTKAIAQLTIHIS